MITSAILLALMISALGDSTWKIDVVYPRSAKQDTISRIDRVNYNFVFGSVTPADAKLKINGTAVPLEKTGAFLAYLPVDWKSQNYHFEAIIDSLNLIEKTVPFVDRSVKPAMQQPFESIEFPIELTLAAGVARSHPDGVYYLFPFQGTKVKAVSQEKGYFQIPLSPEKSVWVEDRHVTKKSSINNYTKPIAWKATVSETEQGDELMIPLNSKPLYRVLSSTNPYILCLDVYNVITHIDIISYQNPSRLIQEVLWEVPSDDVMRLKIHLADKLWGYKVTYEDNSLRVLVRRPPKIRRGVKGLTIAIDPGHGGDFDGSIGALRTTEKEINLKVALELTKILEAKGAKVMLSRNGDVDVGLLKRIKMAEDAEADLMVSLHHNALGDGKDPFGNFGTGTLYYQPLSRDLAEHIQSAVHRELNLYDEGIYYNNMAMVRTTYMPAVLLEAAYMIIPEHEQMMISEQYPKRLAKAVYKGIKSYMDEERKRKRSNRSFHRLKKYSADNFDD